MNSKIESENKKNDDEPISNDSSQANGKDNETPKPTILIEQSNETEKEVDDATTVKKKLNKKRDKIARGKQLAAFTQNLRAHGSITKRQTKSQRAGLIFPVAKLLTKFKQLYRNHRILEKGVVELAAILEYLVAEILDISGFLLFFFF
jgi:hypothetical protein